MPGMEGFWSVEALLCEAGRFKRQIVEAQGGACQYIVRQVVVGDSNQWKFT